MKWRYKYEVSMDTNDGTMSINKLNLQVTPRTKK